MHLAKRFISTITLNFQHTLKLQFFLLILKAISASYYIQDSTKNLICNRTIKWIDSVAMLYKIIGFLNTTFQ